MSHDEHGPIRDAAYTHGPEWWAGELCQCEHHVDDHHQFNLGTAQYFAGSCMADPCECSQFQPLTTTQHAAQNAAGRSRDE